ncbi:hypothetical protein WP50_31495 [Lactiplantibacillus plantarum]|nr:hypothetical protein WP50_31495 [Lactiplantibacillus plantarum]
MEKINSLQNAHVKAWKKLQTKKGRKQQGQYLLDGWHLVNEAVKAHVAIQTLLIRGNSIGYPKIVIVLWFNFMHFEVLDLAKIGWRLPNNVDKDFHSLIFTLGFNKD